MASSKPWEGVSDLAQPCSTSAHGCVSRSVERISNKLAMATASLGMIANGVPLDQIFSDSTLVYIKWQHFLATVFEWACDDVFVFRVGGPDGTKERFSRWQKEQGL